MISVLIGRVMEHFKLKQQELADVLGVSLARVKRLAGGTAQKLKPEESRALVTKLRINPEWLITGEGPMIEEENQDEFVSRMQAINHMNAVVSALPLNELGRKRLQVLMTGDPAEDGRLIGEALLNRGEIEKPKAGPAPDQVAMVTPIGDADGSGLTWVETLAVTVDALHDTGRSLSSEKLFELVDLLMAWQRAGASLDTDTVRAQIRLVS
ncbi:hypothetical protein [uncultured Zoogloea sp.]|uniref:hypothetical protein n=1 Tax=uncultured Zoogloea sp. TaxID=160237 RepID=UPI0026209D65|nr:hypothetical protein [uncultured Zoogloea sp.]